jgi:diguanylate cyclase (GGDEF)-like protein
LNGPFPEEPEPVADGAEQQNLPDVDQTASGRGQAGADLDQASSDLDQLASDRDQQAADRDQLASDQDQKAADRDQLASDRGQAEVDELRGGAGAPDSSAETRRMRAQTTIERDISSHARRESSSARDSLAETRDEQAEARDATARTRDELDAALDAEMAQLDRSDSAAEGGSPRAPQQAPGDHRSAAAVRERGALSREAAAVRERGALSREAAAVRERGALSREAAAVRERGALSREAAARDRAAASADRARAAEDRRAAQADLALEGVDHLTGALRRNGGLKALRRELERRRRTQESLMVAFIDVDGLKAVNDERGHADGDEVLRGVVHCVMRVLRPYDVIMRFGGDEFVCVLSGQDLSSLHERFARAAAELSQRHDGASITVGVAHAAADERAEQLIARADQAMIAKRRRRASPSSAP